MGSDEASGPEHLTERQKKWLRVRAGGAWSATPARTWTPGWRSPAPAPRPSPAPARCGSRNTTVWVRTGPATCYRSPSRPSGHGTSPTRARAALWTDPASAAILAALEAAVAGPRRPGHRPAQGLQRPGPDEFQFAAAKPVKGGTAVLGLAVAPDASLACWSRRTKAGPSA